MRGKRFPRALNHLDGAFDPSPIVTIDHGESFRIEVFEKREQGRKRGLSEAIPQLEVTWRQLRKRIHERLNVESGTADNEWDQSALIEVTNDLPG